MNDCKKLSKDEIKSLLIESKIYPRIFIDDEMYEEKFKQVYHISQNMTKDEGFYTPYIISSFGRLFSFHTGILHQRKPSIDSNGYNLIVIDVNGKKIGVRIHRLVANAFIKNTHKKRNEVNHIDGIKTHNYIWNLEWATSSENKQHAIKNNLAHFAKGEDAGKSKYTNKQIKQVCQMLEENVLSKKDISKITGVSQHIVNDIYKGRHWRHISCDYDFSKRNEDDDKYIGKIFLTCKMIENNKSYKEIENATGFEFRFISDIYRKKKFVWVSDNYDFSKYNYGK